MSQDLILFHNNKYWLVVDKKLVHPIISIDNYIHCCAHSNINVLVTSTLPGMSQTQENEIIKNIRRKDECS